MFNPLTLRAEHSLDWLAAGILQYQKRPATIMRKLQWAHCPGRVQLVPQAIFVREALKARRRGLLRSERHGQHDVRAAVRILAPYPA
jgi:hypothetical protein